MEEEKRPPGRWFYLLLMIFITAAVLGVEAILQWLLPLR